MPIYEYVCLDCGRKFTLFKLNIVEKDEDRCPYCGSTNIKKLVSRVRFVMSEDERLEKLADPSNWSGLDENDPKSIAKFMKKMGNELGEDLGPEFEEVVDRLEKGESPEDIERSMEGDESTGEGVGDFE